MSAPEDPEVDFNAIKDGDPLPAQPQEGEQKAEAEDTKAKTLTEVVDTLKPLTKPRMQTIGPEEDQLGPFIQEELSTLSRIQWFSLVGEVLDRAMSGDNALTIGHLFEMPEGAAEGQINVQQFREADTFLKAMSKLVRYSDSFLVESFLIWLNVADHDQAKFERYMKLPQSRGGLSEDDFFEIVETFIDQNWKAIERFFRERLPQIRRRVTGKTQSQIESSTSSTPSSSTPATTASQ